MKYLFYIAVVLLVVTLCVDGKRPMKKGGRKGGDSGEEGSGRTPPPPPMYSWEREVGDVNVTQSGNVSANDSVAVVGTPPQDTLRNLSLAPALVLYAFSDAADTVSAVKVGRGRRSACFLVAPSAGLTFDGVVQNLEARNTSGLVTGALQEVQVNGTGEALTTDQVDALVTQTPALAKMCRGAKVFQTTAADPAAFPAPGAEEDGQRVVSVVSLDTVVSVLTNTPPALSRQGGRSEDQSGDRDQERKGKKPQGLSEDSSERRPQGSSEDSSERRPQGSSEDSRERRPQGGRQTPNKRRGGKPLRRRG